MPSIEVIIPKGLSPREFRKRICLAAIKAAYGSITEFARAVGVSRQQVYMVLAGKHKSGSVVGALSALTNRPAHELFPPSQRKAA
jgi:hypothetical protein